jgi:bifunctional DNA-binding transcriptional regulator/antitoxin component of YhaV-PrlF toxin-antitoxin module
MKIQFYPYRRILGMRFQWFLCLALASTSYGQTASAPPSAAAGAKAEQAAPVQAPAKTVAPDETVLTVKGTCTDPARQGNDCKTSLTRAEFERLADALQPNMSPPIRRQLANTYARALLMSAAAEKRGLDKQPKFDEMLRFSRMQILSMELTRALQEEAGKISDSEYEEYYHKNAANFEQADFLRIFVPHNKQFVTPKPDMKEAERAAHQKAGEEEMSKLASAIHTRAAKGEDFDALQKEAFTAAGFKGIPPDTKLSKARRTTLPAKDVAVMELKAGEISELISNPSGYYIYKMIAKQELPLDEVKNEIRGTLSSQRYRDAMAAFQKTDNAELNDAYFGATPKPPAPSPAKGDKPAAQEEEDRN